ncbi:protein-tyrosine phosphatase-like protein [Dichotomocladium elegans]|nr:protein-tyrosine phosphatase-like protein [Dichotomocladium elegans]
MFANAVPNHTLRLFPDANHNFTGRYEELVQAILAYFEKHENDSFEKARRMGQTTAVVTPRWIDVEGVKNFRDIGGWPVRDGTGYIRERLVFRCGHLVNVTPKGAETLRQLNVIAAFDMRSEPEIERQGVMANIPCLTRYPSAVFSKDDYSPAALASRWQGYFEGANGFPKVYKVILEKGSRSFRNIFLHMLEHHSRQSTKSLIVHCTAGKDRTGVFIMLLLGLCGVDEEIIARDYALSNLGYWEPESELQKKAEMLNVTIDDMRMVMSAPFLAMKNTIADLKKTYGSIEGYVRDKCGLTTDQIEALRDLMIVKIAFEERQLFRPRF